MHGSRGWTACASVISLSGRHSHQCRVPKDFRLSYLFDSNTCIAVVKGNAGVRDRFKKAVAHGASVFVPSVVAFELWAGVEKRERKESNQATLEAFLSENLQLLSFYDQDARTAARIRANLEIAGTPIGPYDTLIAGQALRHNLTLVTSNAREFRRVKGLKWADWARGH